MCWILSGENVRDGGKRDRDILTIPFDPIRCNPQTRQLLRMTSIVPLYNVLRMEVEGGVCHQLSQDVEISMGFFCFRAVLCSPPGEYQGISTDELSIF